MLDLPALGGYLSERHSRDLFRLETLAHYDVASDDEDFDRYLDGEPAPTASAKRPWLDRLRGDTAIGRKWRRVHVLRPPLSDYLRYECEWGYTYNTEAGEDVRILDVSQAPAGAEILLSVGDFFVIDGGEALRVDYDERGRFRGAIPVDQAMFDSYQVLADSSWHLSVPFNRWWQVHPQYHRMNWSS